VDDGLRKEEGVEVGERRNGGVASINRREERGRQSFVVYGKGTVNDGIIRQVPYSSGGGKVGAVNFIFDRCSLKR
jgi:hypothetical protein